MRTWKSLWLMLIALLFVLISGCAPDAVDSYGRAIRISDYRGKWVVINYWATWCVPCIQEIPDLNKLVRYYKDRVVVLGVNNDNLDNATLRNLAQGYEVNFPFLSKFPIEKWDGKPDNLPVTYIIDPKGRLFQVLKGRQTLANFQAVMSLPEVTYE